MKFIENQNLFVKDPTQSQTGTFGFSTFNSNNLFEPKLSIKLQDNNYLIWTQHMEGVILTKNA